MTVRAARDAGPEIIAAPRFVLGAGRAGASRQHAAVRRIVLDDATERTLR